jgi:hypothetical protein
MFDDIRTSHRRTPSLQLNLEEQRKLDIKPDSGSGILQSPTQSTPLNIHGVKPRENHGTRSWISSSRGPPPPPPVGATSPPLIMTDPPPAPAPIGAHRPEVNIRGPPPPAPTIANRPNVNMRSPPPPLGPPPFPIRQFAPGGPPPPPHFGAPGTTRISDITPAPALTKDYCRRQLTTYEVYTLRKAEPLPTIEKKDVNKTSRSSSKSAPKPSWQRVIINQEAFDQKDIITQIKKLDQTTRSLSTKKAALFPNQHTQVTKLVDEKIATEFDPAFTWTLAQFSRKEITNRSTGNRETQTMTLYLKRAPVAGADTISIFRNIERNRMQNYGFPNPAPGIRSGGGPDTFPGSKNLGANVVNNKVALGIVIVGDERKDSKSTLGRGTGDAPQENGRPKNSPKVHKTGRDYFSDNSSTSTRDSDASWSTDSETSTFETSISSSPSTHRSRHRTGSSRRERDPYRRHEKAYVIRETPRRRPSVAYVPEPPRVNNTRQAAKAAEYERSSMNSPLTIATSDSGYMSQSASSLGVDPVAAEAFAIGVEAATRLAATQRRPPDLSHRAPRSTLYRDDWLPRSLEDSFGELRIRDDLSLNSNLRRRVDRSLDFRGDYFRNEFRRDDLISEDIIRRNERQRDLLDLPRMEPRLGGEYGGRVFEYIRNCAKEKMER